MARGPRPQDRRHVRRTFLSGGEPDHRKKLAAYRGPVLVLHARFDDLVPVTHAERLAEWAGGPVTTRIFERGHHNTILAENDAEYFDEVARFLGVVRAPVP